MQRQNTGTSKIIYLLFLPALVGCNARLYMPDCASDSCTHSILFTDHMAAGLVVGQPDFYSKSPNQGGSPAANTFYDPFGAFSDGSRLVVGDWNNNRVLIFAPYPTQNNASASYVLGQTDFVSTSSSCSQSGLSLPGKLDFDGTYLFVTYMGAGIGRMMGYLGIPQQNNANASFELGHPDFSNCSTQPVSTTSLKANWNLGVRAISDRLLVLDYGYNRVSVFYPPYSNGMASTVVVGQSGPSSSSARTQIDGLSSPADAWTDGKILIVADTMNNRVLIYNPFPTADGASASVVIGQPDFNSGSANRGGSAGPNTLYQPYSVESDGTRLFIADTKNNRVLIFNQIPSSNNASADIVIGQPDFYSSTGNVGPDGLQGPDTVRFDGKELVITDAGNQRVLIYR